MATMINMKMMQTVSCQRILQGCSRLSRSSYDARQQDSYRPSLLVCRRLLSSGSSSDQKLDDGSVAGKSPSPQQQQRPPKRRTDPMAKRPTVKCDPYGQGGKPMSWMEAETLLSTLRLHSDWKLVPTNVQTPDTNLDDSSKSAGTESTVDVDDAPHLPPHALEREFVPTEFLSGAKLVQKLAAVAQLDNHFPAYLTLSRKIVRKEWQVVTVVQCHTIVLGGLSTNDFHLAMLMDVEADRPEVKSLLLSQK